jgi:hypothetical protein
MSERHVPPPFEVTTCDIKVMTKKTDQSEVLAVIDNIEDHIYVIRGLRIMLDTDLADIYQVETRVLNQAVKRNIKRFPSDFVFRLDEQETSELRNSSQFVMSSRTRRGAAYRHYAFTEHGAVMLATVLNSAIAVEASISVVRAFVKMRQVLDLHRELAARLKQLEDTVDKHGEKFTVVSNLLRQILGDPKRLKNEIGFTAPMKKAKK